MFLNTLFWNVHVLYIWHCLSTTLYMPQIQTESKILNVPIKILLHIYSWVLWPNIILHISTPVLPFSSACSCHRKCEVCNVFIIILPFIVAGWKLLVFFVSKINMVWLLFISFVFSHGQNCCINTICYNCYLLYNIH